MGAGFKDFASGAILTAGDVDNYLMRQSVMTFADASARDTALSAVLDEGMVAYLKDTDSVTVYDGSAWNAIGGGGGGGGLVVVKTETAFSAVSSVTADGVFTSDYTNYRLVINYTTSSTGNIAIRLRASASSAATNYNIQSLEVGNTTFNNGRNARTSFRAFIHSNGAYESAGYADVFKPQLATPTNFVILDSSSLSGLTTPYLAFRTGNHSTATAYDGIELLTESGTMTGSYTIYGYSQ